MLVLSPLEKQLILDRVNGWELVEALDISIDEVLHVALQEEWLTQDNVDDALDYLHIDKYEGDQENE